VGPTSEGIIPQPEVERLQAMGQWLHTNGEAIYGTDAGPFSISKPPAWGRATQKTKSGGGATLYVHVWNWPADGKLLLAGVRQAAISGRMLANGAAVSSELNADGLVLSLPGNAPDADASVAALDFAEPVLISHTAAHSVQSESSGTPLDPSGGIPK
jgi:alpha-L-fucosidase